MSDISAVFYLKKIGGTHSPVMCQLAISIWGLLIDNNISISIVHIPGIENTLADRCSRFISTNNDYALCSNGFQLLIDLLPFKPEIDLFATRLTNKLPKYISWHRDPYAWKK